MCFFWEPHWLFVLCFFLFFFLSFYQCYMSSAIGQHLRRRHFERKPPPRNIRVHSTSWQSQDEKVNQKLFRAMLVIDIDGFVKDEASSERDSATATNVWWVSPNRQTALLAGCACQVNKEWGNSASWLIGYVHCQEIKIGHVLLLNMMTCQVQGTHEYSGRKKKKQNERLQNEQKPKAQKPCLCWRVLFLENVHFG